MEKARLESMTRSVKGKEGQVLVLVLVLVLARSQRLEAEQSARALVTSRVRVCLGGVRVCARCVVTQASDER